MIKYITIVNLLLLMILANTSRLFGQFVRPSNTDTEENIQTKEYKLPDIPVQFKIFYPMKKWEISKLPYPWIIQDDESDDIPNSAMIISDNFNLLRQVLDSNNDGMLDDCAYFNSEGNIEFEGIDTNFDQKFDMWIQIENGKYITRIQRDFDYDGYVDSDQKF